MLYALGKHLTARLSSRATMAESTLGVQFPPKRLDLALGQLNELERKRRQGASAASLGEANSGPPPFAVTLSYSHSHDNRWSNVVAYDHSLLPGPYLNASLIPPYTASTSPTQQQRSYIASQAPLPHTLATFFRHVVQHKVQLVVNLTPFHERGRRKADEYWPLKAKEIFETEADAGGRSYTIRQDGEPHTLDASLDAKLYRVTVQEVGGKGQGRGSTSETKHTNLNILHVTSWADFGDMDDVVFLRLLSMVRQEASASTAPIWVHCSAGIGRSGTIIGGLLAQDLDPEALRHMCGIEGAPTTPGAAMEAGLTGATRIVDHERQYRPGMVQTPDQLCMVASLVARLLQQH